MLIIGNNDEEDLKKAVIINPMDDEGAREELTVDGDIFVDSRSQLISSGTETGVEQIGKQEDHVESKTTLTTKTLTNKSEKLDLIYAVIVAGTIGNKKSSTAVLDYKREGPGSHTKTLSAPFKADNWGKWAPISLADSFELEKKDGDTTQSATVTITLTNGELKTVGDKSDLRLFWIALPKAQTSESRTASTFSGAGGALGTDIPGNYKVGNYITNDLLSFSNGTQFRVFPNTINLMNFII